MAVSLYLILMAAFPPSMPILSVMGMAALVHGRWQLRGGHDLVLALPVLSLLGLLSLGATLKGAAQLVTCLVTMTFFMQLGRKGLLDKPARQFAVVTSVFLVLAAPLTIVLNTVPAWLSMMFVPGDHGGIRFRFVFVEPNPLAFIYFFVLLAYSDRIWQSLGKLKWLCVAGSLTAVIAIGSPMALVGMLFVALDLMIRLKRFERIVVITPLLAISVLLIVSPPASIERRIDLLASGEDNSLNLRTWGGLAIAVATLEESGRLVQGAGIGRSRELLDRNPLMELFAAQEESTLPSLAAGTLIEAGYLGLACLTILLILGIIAARRSLSGLLAGALLMLQAASSSFFFDTQFWACLGALLAAGSRSSTERHS